jgi:hypothetical protein
MSLADDLQHEFMKAARELAEQKTTEAVRLVLEERFPNLSEGEYDDLMHRLTLIGNSEVYMSFWLDRSRVLVGELIAVLSAPEVEPTDSGFKFSMETYTGDEAVEFLAKQTARITVDTTE